MTLRLDDKQVQQNAEPLPLGLDTHVFCVAAGTEIECNGKILTVTENAVVSIENRFYCTERIYNQIRAATKRRLS